MFDQTVPNPRNWTFAASLTAQSATVGALLLISMAHVEKLDLSAMRAKFVLRVPPMRTVEIVATPASQRSGPSTHALQLPVSRPERFNETARIPQAVPTVVDAPQDLLSSASGPDGPIGSPLGISGSLPFETAAIAIPKPPPPPPPQPVEHARGPILVASTVLEAMLIRRVMPIYPTIAKNTRTSGTVHLLGIVSKEGKIEQLQVIDGHPLLVQAALDAVRQWLYRPTQLNGSPVEVTAPITVRFILN